MKKHPWNLILLALACMAGPVRGQVAPLRKPTHSIMHFSQAWMQAHHARRAKLPVIHGQQASGTQGINLANRMLLTSCGGPKGWDQGQCGNCWVFGSTAAASIDDGVARGAPQLFSTQWFDSDYYATQSRSTCDGGDDTSFADWYNSHPKFIPWTNTGAGWTDFDKAWDSQSETTPWAGLSTAQLRPEFLQGADGDRS